MTGYPAKANASVDSSSDPASPSASQLSLCAIQLMLADGTTANFVVGISNPAAWTADVAAGLSRSTYEKGTNDQAAKFFLS